MHRFRPLVRYYATKRCSFCGMGNALSTHYCNTCHAPSPIPETVSFYELLDAKAPPKGSFGIDARALRRVFLQAQQKVHPDHFGADEAKKRVAEGTSSIINKAYTTLLDPLARAEYLLKLNGHEVGEEEKITDSAVLMKVMEAREEIEDATKREDLENVQRESESWISEELDHLEHAFREEKFDDAKESAVRLRYWLNIRKAIKEWE